MFGISFKPKSVVRPLSTIEREVEATRARYNEYLKNTSSDYTAQRSNVTIKDPHTTGGAYQVLRGAINGINKVAQKANKKITLKVLFSKKCPYNPIYKTIYLFMITPVKYLPVRFFRQAKNNKKQVCNLMKEKREK